MEVAVKAVERRCILRASGKRSSTRRAPASLRKVILLIVADSFYSAGILSPREAPLPLFRGHSRDRETNTRIFPIFNDQIMDAKESG